MPSTALAMPIRVLCAPPADHVAEITDPLAVRDAGAGWSWPQRYGGACRVRKSIVPPGCWAWLTERADGPGASALREGGRTGPPDECTKRACGSAVPRSGGICRPDPVCACCDCVPAAEAPRRAIPGTAVAAGLRALPGAGRPSALPGCGVMTSPGGTRCRRRWCRSPVKATGIIRSLHRRRRPGGPGSRRWCVPGCRSRGAAGGPGSGSGCGGRPCA